jgi:hypothetical protein
MLTDNQLILISIRMLLRAICQKILEISVLAVAVPMFCWTSS